MRIPKMVLAGCAAVTLLLSGCAAPVTGAAAPAPEALAAARAMTPDPVAPSTDADPSTDDTDPAEDPTAEDPTTEDPTTEEPAPTTAPEPGSSIDPEDFAAQLYAANLTVTSARGSMEMDMSGVTVDATYEMTMADGVADGMSMVMEMAVPDRIEMKMLMADEQFFLGGDSYLELIGLDVAAGKWVRLDPDAANRTVAGMAREMEASMRMQGPTQITSMVDMAESVEFVGTEEVEGQSRDHYTLQLDGEKALELGAGAAGGTLPPGVEIGTIPMELWLDDQGRTTRMTMSMELGGESVEMAMNLFDFDEPVVIEVPSADEIAD